MSHNANNKLTILFSPGTSPLLKMSFETTTKFLSEATLYGDYDSLRSPSACIAMGRPIRCVLALFAMT